MPPAVKQMMKYRPVVHDTMGPCWAVSFRFDREMTDAVNRAWATPDRSWKHSDKAWFIKIAMHDPSGSGLLQFFKTRGYACAIDPDLVARFPSWTAPSRPPPGSRNTAPPGPSDAFFKRRYATAEDYAVLHLADGAPIEIAKAAFRALAQKHHPDQGGDAGTFQRINMAFQRIEAKNKEPSS